MMEKKEIIEKIIEKFHAGDDDDEIKKFLERIDVKSEEWEFLIENAKNKILEFQLKTYPKQNKLAFIFWILLFLMFSIFFLAILPLFQISNAITIVSIFGSICITLSGFNSLLYYKSWKKDFIEKVGKPNLDLGMYFLLSIFPNIAIYAIISWNYINNTEYNLYKFSITLKAIRLLFH